MSGPSGTESDETSSRRGLGATTGETGVSGSPLEAVAQAIREHQFISWPSNGKQPMCCLCQQGCSGPDGYMLEMDFREHAEHVAVAVLAALELREETKERRIRECAFDEDITWLLGEGLKWLSDESLPFVACLEDIRDILSEEQTSE